MSDATSTSLEIGLVGYEETKRRKVSKHPRSFGEVARAWKYKVVDKMTNSEAITKACEDFDNVLQEGAVPESDGGHPGSIMNHYKKRIMGAINRAKKSGTVHTCPLIAILKAEGIVKG